MPMDRDALAPAARRHALRAQRHRLPPGHLPRPRRRGRDHYPPVRGRARRAGRVLRRRDRVDRRDRPAAGQGRGAAEAGDDLSREPLRGAGGASSEGLRRHRGELAERVALFHREDKLLEAQRSSSAPSTTSRCSSEMGFCHGVENYSRWLDGRNEGETPYTLYDYFPEKDRWSCSTRATSRSPDRRHVPGRPARKETLVEFGWRLPSALDNRPLRFEEWEERAHTSASTSRPRRATTSSKRCQGVVVEQIIRPTGPDRPAVVEIRPANGPGRRPAGGDPQAREGEGAGARHHADQADGRGADRLLRRARGQGPLPPQRHPDDRAHRDHPRAAGGRLRRAGRDQPAARGPRHPGGLPRRDPRRRQGGLPALRRAR